MRKIYFLFALLIMCGSVVSAAPRKASPRKASTVQTPQTLPATDITETGFTANWKAVPGASVYQVTTYAPYKVEESGLYTVLFEAFNGVELGTTVDPFIPDEYYVNLAEYDMVDTPDWQGFLPVFARGMVGGIIYSPYIDLTHDGGKFRVILSVVGTAGAMVKLEASGTKNEVKELHLKENGLNEFIVDFTCGSHDTYLTYTDYGIQNDPDGLYTDVYAFLDDIEIQQNLKAGEEFLSLVDIYETPEDSGITSHRFDNMQFLKGATELAYDVMAISVVYNDPFDDWDYDVYYSDYSNLEYVTLLSDSSGIDAVEASDAAAAEYYDLNGIRVTGELAPGLYIRREGEKISKILVK